MTSVLSPVTKAVIPDFGSLAQDRFSLRLATTEDDVIAAQRLRYEVFYTEMAANPSPRMLAEQREIEAFDPFCDHLLVIDNNAPADRQVIGTYRILTQDVADAHQGFYTETEFDIGKLRARGGKILEVSRSCVLKSYRDQPVINLLWRGIAAYVEQNGIDFLIGVPSLTGTDITPHLATLTYLQQHHLAGADIRPVVRPEFAHSLPEAAPDERTAKQIFLTLPPLIKGYLRIGALIGDGVYVDEQFNCIDICIVVPVDASTSRYFDRFTR